MRKISIGNFQLPAGKNNVSNSGRLLPRDEFLQLQSIASGNVMKIALRAIERAEKYDCGHPFWNSLAGCYVNVIQRFILLNDMYPGITRIIHNSEVKKGDVLVSDFFGGLNYGYMYGGTEPVKVRVLEVDGDVLKGTVLRSGSEESKEIGYFRNELWFFICHKFVVYSSGKRAKRVIGLK